jgi:hypothetical protein
VELYDLQQDPQEEHDLAASMPEKRDELTRILKAWQQETKAAVPSQDNPAFDTPGPKNSRTWRTSSPGPVGREDKKRVA